MRPTSERVRVSSSRVFRNNELTEIFSGVCRHFFGSLNLGTSNDTLRMTVDLTEEIARQLRLTCPWKDPDVREEFAFLERVMRS